MRDVLPHCRNGLVVSVVRREQGVEREWRESDAEVREGCSSGCKRTQETLYAKRTLCVSAKICVECCTTAFYKAAGDVRL